MVLLVVVVFFVFVVGFVAATDAVVRSGFLIYFMLSFFLFFFALGDLVDSIQDCSNFCQASTTAGLP